MRIRAALPLLLLAGLSCGGGLPAGRTSVFLTVQNGAGLDLPEDLQVTAYADGASLYTNERVPRSGTLGPAGSNGEIGTLTIYAPDTAAELRVVVAGYSAGAERSEGTTTVRLAARRQVAAQVTLAVFTGGGDGGPVDGSGGVGGGGGGAGIGGTGAGGAADGGTIDSRGGDASTDASMPGDATDGATADGPAPDLGAICQSSSLAGTSETPASVIDLTAEGAQDWRFWGPSGATTFKRTAGDKISDYTLIGSGTIATRFRNSVAFSWSDGSPTLSQTGAADTMSLPPTLGAGASIMVPATSTARTLSVYVGGANDTGTIEASLSDGCVTDYVATASNGRNDYNVVYRFTFKSAVPGAVLRIRWTMSGGFEAIGLYAATLK